MLGFLGRNMQAADLFLREAPRSSGARRERFQTLAVRILDSFARLGMSPPEAEGFWLDTGRPTNSAIFLRSPTEDLYYMLAAWRRERDAGREHPQWLVRCREFAAWLLTQQNPEAA